MTGSGARFRRHRSRTRRGNVVDTRQGIRFRATDSRDRILRNVAHHVVPLQHLMKYDPIEEAAEAQFQKDTCGRHPSTPRARLSDHVRCSVSQFALSRYGTYSRIQKARLYDGDRYEPSAAHHMGTQEPPAIGDAVRPGRTRSAPAGWSSIHADCVSPMKTMSPGMQSTRAHAFVSMSLSFRHMIPLRVPGGVRS